VNCADFVVWIAERLEGSLRNGRNRILEDHLADCARCRDELFLQKSILEALAEEGPSGLSADFTRRVSRQVREIGTERPVSRWPLLVPAVLVGAAVVALAFLLGGQLGALPWGSFGQSVSAALALVGEAIAGVFSHAPDVQESPIPQPILVSVLGTLIGSVPMIWAFRRIFAFLRES
jgi:anti-sigma factor RsiW